MKAETSLDLGNIALCYLGLGRISEATQHFDQALKLAREASLKKEEALWQKGKASALVQIGKYTEALDQYRQALQTYEQAELKQPLIEARWATWERLKCAWVTARQRKEIFDVLSISHAQSLTRAASP